MQEDQNRTEIHIYRVQDGKIREHWAGTERLRSCDSQGAGRHWFELNRAIV